jgi:hypothetical protein
MKKVGLCLLIAMLVITLVGTTNAQGVKLGGKADSAKEITISGELDLNTVSRDSGLTSALDGTPAPGKTKSDSFITPRITLDFDIDVGDKVAGFLRLATRQVTGGLGNGQPATRLGNINTNPAFTQAYVKVSEFITPDLNFTIGLQDLKFTLRKGEGAFFMDIANSRLIAAAATATGGFSEFGGFTFHYGNIEKSNYAVDVFQGTVWETGSAHKDEALFGAHVDYKLPQGEKNMVKALLVLSNTAPGAGVLATYIDANIMTIGAGCDYWAMPALEVYGEFYSQSGDFAHYWNATTLVHKAIKQSASAFRVGGQYDLSEVLNKPDLKPYAGLSYWSLSGDNQDPSKDNKDFVSYSNVQSTLITEDKLLGLGLDTNYTAIKIEAGITTSIDINKDGKGEELGVKLLVGQFTMATAQKYAVAATRYWGGALLATGALDDGLGQEIDIVTTLKYTESLSFTLGLGQISGVDNVEDVNGANIDKGSATMITFDTRLKF